LVKILPICGLLDKTFASAQSTNKELWGVMGAINTKHLHHSSTLFIKKITEKKKKHCTDKHTTRKTITKHTNMKKHDKKIACGCFALLVFYYIRVIRFEFFVFSLF
jgi:hypothetical protein